MDSMPTAFGRHDQYSLSRQRLLLISVHSVGAASLSPAAAAAVAATAAGMFLTNMLTNPSFAVL
jgi:hypothetical protein